LQQTFLFLGFLLGLSAEIIISINYTKDVLQDRAHPMDYLIWFLI